MIMKTNRFLSFLLATGLVISASSCSEDALDEIDTNPNRPEDVSSNLLMPQVTVNVPTSVTGADLGWYSSVFVQHTAGVHGQMQSADRRAGNEDATLVNNVWNNIYAGVLPDLDAMIRKGSEGGTEEGLWRHVGIAKVLKAYTVSVATDAWGRVPFSDAGQGIENRTPTFDTQQQIYTEMQRLLDEAIMDLAKTAPSPGSGDFIYAGDAAKWTKAAYSLKARYYNRLSNIDPTGSATSALEAASLGFTSNADNFTFNRYVNSAIGEHPWFQELNDRSHHAVSASFVQTLTTLNDPRLQVMVGPARDTGAITGAPNGTQTNDQANRAFSDVTTAVLNPTAPMPMMTFDELKFIEAEANLRLGNTAEAYTAFQQGVRAAMARQIMATTDQANTYLANAALPQSGAALTLEDIIRQKWISFFYFQPFEAYNDWRRTGLPAFIGEHQISAPPMRFPYPQNELDANAANVPATRGPLIYTNGVWWADGSED